MNDRPDFFVAGGSLRLDTGSYVTRPADQVLFEHIQAGEFCYILTSRQMGKSSLMIRTARRLRQAGWQTALIDLTGIGTDEVDVDAWYQGLLTRLTFSFHLPVDVQQWWVQRADQTVAQRFITFLHEVVLAEISQPVVIFIDEIDSTLKLDFSDDFFAAIRAIYNERAIDPIYQRLTFVLLGVATPSDLIKDQTRTPFNIGQRIDLREFSRLDAQVLVEGLEASFPGQGAALLERILYWTNGHPYLTQKLCLAALEAGIVHWDEVQIDRLVQTTFLSDEGRNDTNLKFVQSSIQARPKAEQRAMLDLYHQVYRGQAIKRDERSSTQNHLILIGLVGSRQDHLIVRNEIYRQVFDLAWIAEIRPSNAQLRWAVGAGLVAALSLLVLVAAIFFRQDPPAIRAELCRNDFLNPASKAVQLEALACLFDLGAGYDEEARRLFFSLPPGKQQYLFVDWEDPAAVDSQLIAVVNGVSVALEVMPEEHDLVLIEKMRQPLAEINQPEATQLVVGLEHWRRGRKAMRQRSYPAAIAAFGEALAINNRQPVIRYDRAMAYIALTEYNLALQDLEEIVKIANEAPPTPTPTPTTPTETDTPTSTPTPTDTATPTKTPTPGSVTKGTPSSTTTLIPSVTPTVIQMSPGQDLKFLNADRIKETIRQTIENNRDLQVFLGNNMIRYPAIVALMGNLVIQQEPITVKIRVLDAETGAAISMARIHLFVDGRRYMETTDLQGRISISPPAIRTTDLDLIVEASGYIIGEFNDISTSTDGEIEVLLKPVQGTEGNVILVVIDATMLGTVAGAEVTVTIDGNIFTQSTDSNGIARISIQGNSIEASIQVKAAGYPITTQNTVLVLNRVEGIQLSPADAVITIDDGFVSLLRGPGLDYDAIGTLRKGDKVNIERRLFDRDDWLKISVDTGSGGGVTGWITTDPIIVDINVELAAIPPMYEFGPHLLTPKPFESRGVDDLIEFQWEAAPYPLEENQYYSLLLVRDDLPDDAACFHWQTKETKLSLTPEEEGCTAGAYGWRVGIATDLNDGVGERNWRDDTEFDEKNPIGIGIPYPGRPLGVTPTSTVFPTFTPNETLPEVPTPDFVVAQQRMRTNEENSLDGKIGDCGEDHSVYVTVVDAAGSPLEGMIVGDTFGNVQVASGTAGLGKATIQLWSNTMILEVQQDIQGTTYTSEQTIPLSTKDEDIPSEWLLVAGYCTSLEECVTRQQTNSLCRGHYSYDVVFQRTW